MIRDRGTIKWTAMMLPEHVSLIREMQAELQIKPKPSLDSQKLEEINEIICQAAAENRAVVVTYYEKGEYRPIVGYIHYADMANQRLMLVDLFDERARVPFDAVLDVKFHEYD